MTSSSSAEQLNSLETFKEVEKSLELVRDVVHELTKAESLKGFENKLHPHETAKLNVSLAFTLASLYFILMKTKGSIPSKDGKSSILNEIDRIRSYVTRLNEHKEEKQPKLKIDAAAAKRIIEHQTSLGKRKQDVLR